MTTPDLDFAAALRAVECGSGKEQPHSMAALSRPSEPANLTLIAQLKARGLTHDQISAATGLAPASIVAVVTQPEFRRRLVRILTTDASANFDAYKLAEGVNSLATLAELRDDPATPRNTRATCAVALADRAWGKPTVAIEHSQRDKALPADDAAQVVEIERLEKELARLKAN